MTVSPDRVDYLGLSFDRLTLDEAAAALAARPADARFAYLVTPNVDHLVRLHDPAPADRDAIWQAYRGATWCTCDSRIVAALARRQGIDLPVAPGSDLTVALLTRHCRSGDRIAIIGGSAATADAVRRRFPEFEVIHHEPPMGLRRDPAALAAAADVAAGARARFLFLAVGSPQQELLAQAIARDPRATGIGLCIGAAIEFVVGERRRAPRLLQRLHLEWAFRLAADPVRLWRRYLVTGPRIFLIARRSGSSKH